jgi:hypothetical protein
MGLLTPSVFFFVNVLLLLNNEIHEYALLRLPLTISITNLPHARLMYGLIQRHRRLKCAFTRVFLPLMSPTFSAGKLIGGMQFSAIQSASEHLPTWGKR